MLSIIGKILATHFAIGSLDYLTTVHQFQSMAGDWIASKNQPLLRVQPQFYAPISERVSGAGRRMFREYADADIANAGSFIIVVQV